MVANAFTDLWLSNELLSAPIKGNTVQNKISNDRIISKTSTNLKKRVNRFRN